jgi:hypothetical protein
MKLAVSSRFVVNFESGSGRPELMADDWVKQRLKKFEEKTAADHQRQNWNHKAIARYDTMFDELKERVRADVEAYNKVFASHRQCAASFAPDGSGFRVSCQMGGMIAFVKRDNGQIISIGWGHDPMMRAEKSDTLEIVADDQGDVRYKHKKGFLADVSEASELILDPVLCK